MSWCVAYRYNEPLGLHWAVLSVPKSARIAVIDLPPDVAALIEETTKYIFNGYHEYHATARYGGEPVRLARSKI